LLSIESKRGSLAPSKNQLIIDFNAGKELQTFLW
jgi:hypothetical protein